MAFRAYAVGMMFLLGTACGEKVDDQPGFGPGGGSMGSGSGTDGSGSSGDSESSGPGTSDSATTNSSDSASSGGGTTSGTSGGTSSTSSTSGGNTSNTGGGACGNGTIDAGEQCDGADLNGFDCTSLGYTGGTLSCDAVTCTFDTSLCMSGTGGTSG